MNLFENTAAGPEERFEELLAGGEFRLERIVSTGQATPAGQWFDQEEDEWVVLLSGAARLRLLDPEEVIDLRPGDCLNIAARRRHRVESTHPEEASVWLALHYRGSRPNGG